MIHFDFAGISADALAGDCHCGSCGRAPLVGERIHLRPAGDGSRWVCDVCDTAVASVGPPLRTERVRSTAGTLTVRRAA